MLDPSHDPRRRRLPIWLRLGIFHLLKGPARFDELGDTLHRLGAALPTSFQIEHKSRVANGKDAESAFCQAGLVHVRLHGGQQIGWVWDMVLHKNDLRIFPKVAQQETSYSQRALKRGYLTPMERDAIVMLVARNIEDLMARKQITAPELARQSGLNPTGIYDILSGKSRSPRLDTLHKIAVALGVPFNALFTEPDEALIDRELLEALGMMSQEDRKRFLAMARALSAQPSNV